jgi:pentose-5-phosphate-3-epimerase
LDFLIEVDGSNNYDTFETYYKNGTDIFILGSTLFKEKDLEQSFLNIKKFIGQIND